MPVWNNTNVPQITCPSCKNLCSSEAMQHTYICPSCGTYIPIGARERLHMILDSATFQPWFENAELCDPLAMPDYPEKWTKTQQKSGYSEAITVGYGKIRGLETVIGVCNPNFIMGSMGRCMGERITLADVILAEPRS